MGLAGAAAAWPEAGGGPRPAAEPEDLPLIVVTATQEETEAFHLPYTVESLGTTDLERLQPLSLPTFLEEVPGVMVQKTGYGMGSPFIRGFTGFRTLMLIDGVRLNNSTFREGPNQYWNTVDIFSVDRLELVKGPSSVLYGSDAIGGTANALTVGRQDYGPSSDVNGRAYYRYATAENSNLGRAEFSGNLRERLGYHVGLSLKSFGDVEGGAGIGVQPHTGYEEGDLDLKLNWHVQPNLRLDFAHQSVRQDDIWRTHSTPYGNTWEGLRPGSDRQRSYDQERHLTYLQSHATGLNGAIEEVHAGISHHLQGEDQSRIRQDGRQEPAGNDVNTLGLWGQLHSPSRVGRWVYGLEYYRDWVDSYSYKYRADGTLSAIDLQGPVADDATYDLAGVYVQNRLPDFGPVELTLGGRYNYAGADAAKVRDPITGQPTSFSDAWNALVGSGRVLVHVDEARHWNLFAGASQGFRAPNLSDLTRFDIAEAGQIETPATDVAPEYYLTLEAGVKARFDRLEAQASYYYTDIQDMIMRTPTGRTVDGLAEVTKRNSGEGFVHGVELSGTLHLGGGVSFWAAFSWMEGTVEAYPTSDATLLVKEPLSRLMPATGWGALRWEHPNRRFWAEVSCTIAADQQRLSSADLLDLQRIPPGGTPGYGVANLRGGWRPCPNADLTLALENLSDEAYRIHGSGLMEPGRNFVVALDLRF